MRLARQARAALTGAHSDSETGPFAELATVNRENVRLRAKLAAAEAQLSAHLLNCEAPASAEGPVAPTAQGPARTKLPPPNADEASLDAARCWDRLSPRRCHSWSVPLIRARHAGLGRHGSRRPGPTSSYTTRYPTFALHCTLQLPALSSLTDPPSLPCGRRPTLAHASESKLDAVADAGDVLLEVKPALAADLERVEREAQSKRSDARAEAAGGQLVRRR